MLLLTQLITKLLYLEKEGQGVVKQIQILLGYHEDDIMVKSLMIEEILNLFWHGLNNLSTFQLKYSFIPFSLAVWCLSLQPLSLEHCGKDFIGITYCH